jgi:long-chain acyl-CoA synthetase
MAAGLRRLGVRPGDRVLVTMTNCPQVGKSYLATWIAGATVVPALFLLPAEELTHIAADCRPTVIVTTADLVAKAQLVAAAVPSIASIVAVGGGEGVVDIEELVEGEQLAPESRSDDDPAVILYTSGTTGSPKGVVLSHGNLRAAADQAHAAWDVGDDQVGLGCLPFSHVYGLTTSLASTKRRGRAVLVRWFDAAEFLRLVDEFRVTITALVPAMMVALLDHPERGRWDTSSLRYVVSGAAPLPLELLRRFEDAFGCTVLQGYGLSETAGQCTLNTPEHNRPGSVGRPIPGVEVAIVGLDGTRLGPMDDGEIRVRGANVMRGYYERPEETATAFVDGWLRTGDVGHVDEDGYLYVVDRLKDLIIRGGFNVVPRDVEDVLATHPAVAQAAVIGLPHPRLGELVHADVVLRPGEAASPEDLLAHCRQRLASYKCPASIHIVSSLPMTATGKVLKRRLREEHVSQHLVG